MTIRLQKPKRQLAAGAVATRGKTPAGTSAAVWVGGSDGFSGIDIHAGLGVERAGSACDVRSVVREMVSGKSLASGASAKEATNALTKEFVKVWREILALTNDDSLGVGAELRFVLTCVSGHIDARRRSQPLVAFQVN